MTLDEFLQELSARRGLHRKIGLLTGYWRHVQRLPADKQRQVALALGSKAAWNGLEKLFAKDGTLSDGELAVKRALDRVGGADPDELRELASKVRAGNYDLDEALRLTANLHSDTQKAWCLGDLVQHWALAETELELVLGAACSPTAASRLRRRHARQGRSRSAAGANQGVGC